MIIKEQIEVRGSRDIAVSECARFLSAGVVDGGPVVWLDEPLMDRRDRFAAVMSAFTGDDAPDPNPMFGPLPAHLGTIVNNGIVVHVFVPAHRLAR